jgi:hypothetical protein
MEPNEPRCNVCLYTPCHQLRILLSANLGMCRHQQHDWTTSSGWPHLCAMIIHGLISYRKLYLPLTRLRRTVSDLYTLKDLRYRLGQFCASFIKSL